MHAIESAIGLTRDGWVPSERFQEPFEAFRIYI